MNAQELTSETRQAIETCKRRTDEFLALAPDAPATEVARAFDAILLPLNGWVGRAGLFSQTHPDAAMREAALEMEQEISAFKTDLSLNRDVFDRLVALEPGLEQVADAGDRRLIEHALRDYRRSGVDRDEATRARIRKLNEELVEVGQSFDKNIITGGRTFVIEDGHAGLAGLPEDFLASHPEDEQGRVTLSTDPQDRMPFMTYAHRGDLRHGFYREIMNRAMPDNLEVLGRLLALRHELATLLGYAHWADYVTEVKMIGSGKAARQFIDRTIALARPRAEAEYADLLEEKQETEPGADVVHEWESEYLKEKIRAKRYGFDSQAVRPYFAYDKVRDGVLATTASLYGVEFRRDAEAPVWHPSVECYEILDGGETIARFFLDMHPRENKYKHAAMFDVVEGVKGVTIPEACLLCNFPEPKAGDPALLLHDQVTTFFHEFGHLMHHLFAGGQRYLSFAGISTEWDFVEVPSQMYEEWAWDAGVLARFATHHQDGSPIPADLVKRMRDAEEYGKCLRTLRQMVFASLSLSYYDRDPAGIDTDALMIENKRAISPFPHEQDTHMQASFGHLHGYSATYYTYMWSLVIAKDVFSRFEGDLMNTGTANEWRETVLGAGGSRDAAVLVEDFLGREYGFEAFESWLNR